MKVITYLGNEIMPSVEEVADYVRPFYILRSELFLAAGTQMINNIIVDTLIQAIQTENESLGSGY